MQVKGNSWHANAYRYWFDKSSSIARMRLKGYDHEVRVPDPDNKYNHKGWTWETRTVPPQTLTLCRYFWTVVLRAPLLWFFKGGLQKKGRPLEDVPAVVPAIVLAVLSFAVWKLGAGKVGLGIVGLVLGIAVVIGVCIGATWLKDEVLEPRLRETKEEREKRKIEEDLAWAEAGFPPKQPGLLRSFLHAKKAKVCPMIEFTSDP